jgi:hypothetical protein
MFYVGQKVVKIPGPGNPGPHPAPSLVNGDIYTIRKIDIRLVDLGRHPAATILVMESRIPPKDYPGIKQWEHGYNPIVFRPLVERKTDISIFKKMLEPNSVPVLSCPNHDSPAGASVLNNRAIPARIRDQQTGAPNLQEKHDGPQND